MTAAEIGPEVDKLGMTATALTAGKLQVEEGVEDERRRRTGGDQQSQQGQDIAVMQLCVSADRRDNSNWGRAERGRDEDG